MTWHIVWDGDIPRIMVTLDGGITVPLSDLIDCEEVHHLETAGAVSEL